MCDRVLDRQYLDDYIDNWSNQPEDQTGYVCTTNQDNLLHYLFIVSRIKKNKPTYLSQFCKLCYTIASNGSSLVIKSAGYTYPIYVRISDISKNGNINSECFTTPQYIQTIHIDNLPNIKLRRVEYQNKQYWFIEIKNCKNIPLPIYLTSSKQNRLISPNGELIPTHSSDISKCAECDTKWIWK